jgi:predicted RNA-binding protein with RPS1 domain
MKGLNNSLSAEFIKILDNEVKSVEVAKSTELVGKELNGLVGSIVEFGVFVKLVGLRDGLLHINNMPKDLKSNYKEQLVKGQSIKVKIVKVTEKGIELKYIQSELEPMEWLNFLMRMRQTETDFYSK